MLQFFPCLFSTLFVDQQRILSCQDDEMRPGRGQIQECIKVANVEHFNPNNRIWQMCSDTKMEAQSEVAFAVQPLCQPGLFGGESWWGSHNRTGRNPAAPGPARRSCRSERNSVVLRLSFRCKASSSPLRAANRTRPSLKNRRP